MDINFLLTVSLISFPLLCMIYFRKTKEFVRLFDGIPGPKSHPILGNVLKESRVPNSDLVTHDYKRFKKYGPICRTWVLHIPVAHCYSAELCEVILGGMKHLEKSFSYLFLIDWLGQGLLTSTGRKWHSHRKMITPTFHFNILEKFLDVMIEKSNILVQVLEKASKDGKVFNVFPHITNATLDIICETAMGTDIGAQRMAQSDYVTAIYSLSELVVQRTTKPWLMISDSLYSLTPMGKKWQKSLSHLHGFTEKIIKGRREARKLRMKDVFPTENADSDIGKKRRVAFLDLLLDVADKNSFLTDTDIRDEVDTFMFEGHDTTTAGISWTIYLLGLHPDIQEKAYQEIKDIFNGEDRPISFQDMNEMKYLERVIKESLRLYPPVPGFGRKVEENIHFNGYTIPAGAFASIHVYSMHRNPEHFPNPESFNPDNFLPENVKNRHPFAYVPFSAGPRNCIGQKFALMEEKTVLVSILRRFKITSVDKPEDITLMAELILRPKCGINITLEPR